MDHVNGSKIAKPTDCNVRCTCIVDLVSRKQRPYLFKVTVTGQPPHAVTIVYEIAAKTDDSAAAQGMDRFVKDMLAPIHPVLALLT